MHIILFIFNALIALLFSIVLLLPLPLPLRRQRNVLIYAVCCCCYFWFVSYFAAWKGTVLIRFRRNYIHVSAQSGKRRRLARNMNALQILPPFPIPPPLFRFSTFLAALSHSHTHTKYSHSASDLHSLFHFYLSNAIYSASYALPPLLFIFFAILHTEGLGFSRVIFVYT